MKLHKDGTIEGEPKEILKYQMMLERQRMVKEQAFMEQLAYMQPHIVFKSFMEE